MNLWKALKTNLVTIWLKGEGAPKKCSVNALWGEYKALPVRWILGDTS